MVGPKMIDQLPNWDYIRGLGDFANCVSRFLGKHTFSREIQEPDGCGDYKEHTVCDYLYKDEKITIETTSGYMFRVDNDEDLVVKVTLSATGVIVFRCDARLLYVYRTGAWGKYMLSLGDAVLEEYDRRARYWSRNRKENAFKPIDDSNLF